ncbi:MAG: SbcC/MukB-like Walker B domain-containing protein [Bacilli bacterium]|nr:SbcC/MukB-like Walker B domain-containing protein [Bacilli bacterium]MDD4520439.1 SbcC/MukB-like Walker B domain-containing protein [Bacilli bacterium]
MKLLKRAKVINWHYFWNETIDFEQIVFLTGLNASGKSTLIDAMQVILLGDTSGRFFNKAAMDKSNRTLRGYLRGELGDNVEGGFHYLRNGRFTSYIALEFADQKSLETFTVGCVFDVYEDGSEEHRFFALDFAIPENEFITNKIPMDYKTLVAYLNDTNNGKFTFFDSNRQYQDYIKRRFGGLKDKYFSLLKKSISFTPITDITTFITEYVCDPQTNIDIVPMQDNILQYKKLENEALIMKARVERLEEISHTYKMFEQQREEMQISSYQIEKAGYYNDKKRLDSYYEQITTAKRRLIDIDVDLAETDKMIADLQRKKTRYIQDKANSDTYRLTDELTEQKLEAEKRKQELTAQSALVVNNLNGYLANFIAVAQGLIDTLDDFNAERLENDQRDELRLLKDSALQVLNLSIKLRDQYLDQIELLAAEDLLSWREALSLFQQRIAALSLSIGRNVTTLEQKLAMLKQQEVDMHSGGKSYEWALSSIKRSLQDELTRRHGEEIPVMIFADLCDIKSPKWANAIEGYLYNQKFNLFVESAYYMEAYNILRDLLDKNHYYGTTLIDQDRIIERNFEADAQSLAEEIITDHPGARAYANYLIGRLRKCQNLNEARSSGNGITADGDLYRNFGFGKINPRLYREHIIGRSIGQDQIVAKQAEIALNQQLLTTFRTLNSKINDAGRLEIINTNEINSIVNILDSLKALPGLEKTIDYLTSELSKHDLTQLESLQKRIDAIDEDLLDLEKERAGYFEEKGRLNTQMNNLINERIPEVEKACNTRLKTLEEHYDVFLVNEKAEPLFEKQVQEGKTPLDIIAEYNLAFSHAQYLVNNLYSQLVKLRKDYVRDYRLTYETDLNDNILYQAELNDIREVQLPLYEGKIHDAYEKAITQFKNDFIAKLRGAIETVEDQIEELNHALGASTFGNDSYQFTVRPSATYRAYYDMITDDLLLEIDQDETAFLAKYDQVMKDLFAQIALAGDKENNAAVLANVEKFTDYRNYLDFDLVVKDKAGNEQRLSKMIKKKSGGETQTPFYISVLASFAQLYHVQDSGELSNTIRLIIFDEAFSKMDSGRIRESIRLLRKFGLQAIVSAPSDKVADISALVDETLVVLRGKNASHVRLYAEEEKISA